MNPTISPAQKECLEITASLSNSVKEFLLCLQSCGQSALRKVFHDGLPVVFGIFQKSKEQLPAHRAVHFSTAIP